MSHSMRIPMCLSAAVWTLSAAPSFAQPVRHRVAADRPDRAVTGARTDVPTARSTAIARTAIARTAIARTAIALDTAPSVRRPRRAAYVIGGALIGGAAMAAGIAVSLAGGSECTCTPFVYAPAVATGLVVGAGAGYVVHRIRFR